MEWENSIFYPKKYENFYGCELIIAWNEENFNNDIEDLLELTFKDQLNAKLTLTRVESLWNCEDCDLTTQEVPILHDYYTEITVSDPVISNNGRFVIAPGEPYTDLERMFMMFDFELWIAILVTFVIAFIVTMSLRFVSQKVRNFIVGRYVQNPTMNLISTFLTGPPGSSASKKLCKIYFDFVHFLVADHPNLPSIHAF